MPSNFKMNKPKLEGHSVEHTYLRQRAFDGSVNKTILKPQLAVVARRDFPDVKFRVAAYKISEKAIRFRHPDYDPDRAQKLFSSSMSRHLSTRNISSKSMHAFWVILPADRQTDKQTRAKTCTASFVGGKQTRLCITDQHCPLQWLHNDLSKLSKHSKSTIQRLFQGRTQDFISGGAGWRAREREPIMGVWGLFPQRGPGGRAPGGGSGGEAPLKLFVVRRSKK